MLPSAMLEVRYYFFDDGRSPFEAWFADLGSQAAAKVTVALARLEQGNFSNVKPVGHVVLEYRIDWGTWLAGLLRQGRRPGGDLVGRRDEKAPAEGHRSRKTALGRLFAAVAAAVVEADMVLTKGFKELVQARAARDPGFAEALLREGIEAMLVGDVDTGKTVLRDYINATVGFEKLGEATATSPKSLMRMFGSRGNPQARNLFGVIGYLQAEAGLKLHVAVERQARPARRARHDSAKTAA